MTTGVCRDRRNTTKGQAVYEIILRKVLARGRAHAARAGIGSSSPRTRRQRTFRRVQSSVARWDHLLVTLTANSGTHSDSIASPKLSLIFGPWEKTEIYVQGGLGFHSNDGRGATTTVDPVTGDAVPRADPLVQTYGAEIGVRTLAMDGLQSTLSFWWLDIDSELLFVGDAGATEASRPSRRYGVEWANYYHITKNLTLDADFSFSHAEFRDYSTDGDHIPGSIESVVAAGITYQSDCGFFASLRLRYFGPRPLKEDDSFRSDETILLNGQIGYRINKTWTVSAEVLNILDRKDHDIDYAYESRVALGADVNEEIHFHPVEPIQARFAITARF